MKKIILFFTLFYGLSVAHTQAQQKERYYTHAAIVLDSVIQQRFYIADSGYYRENPIGYTSEKPVSYLWSLCAMVQADNELESLFPKKNFLPRILSVIQKYYDPKPPAAGYASYTMEYKGEDRYYDDNQWIGIAALDAYSRTHKKDYLHIGKTVYDFMMTGYDTISGGGIYWVETKKESKNTCSNGPGILVALGMYSATKKSAYLDTAILIYDWVNKHLKTPTGLYYDNYRIANGHIDSALYSYNAGTMLESAAYLYTITKDKKYLKQAIETAAAAEKYFLATGKFRDDYWFSAVLMRGYIRLYTITKDPTYLISFKKCTDYALQNDMDSAGLMGKNKPHNLVGQGGMLEILTRMAFLMKKNII